MKPLSVTAACVALLLAGCDDLSSSVAAPDTPRAHEPLAIGLVQGGGGQSPRVGERVLVDGVVTGNFVTGLGGFFLQDAVGADDGDPSTADGLFVQYPRDAEPRVRRGDRLLVQGVVTELGRPEASLTALTEASVEVRGRGQAPVVALSAPPASAAEWERYEGMQVEVTVPLTVTGNGELLRYGALHASFGERLFQATELHPPGEAAQRLEADNLRRQLVLDDNRDSENPNRLWFLPAPPDDAQPLRVGSQVRGVRGVLDQRHGAYRLQLTEALGAIEQAPRPAPPAVPGALRVAALNLENLFNGDGRGGGFPTERGARTLRELERQRGKLVAALLPLQADIVALMEVENDGYGPRSSLQRFVDAVNAALGDAGDYAAIPLPAGPGDDAIRVALVYRRGRVVPVGAPVVLDAPPFGPHSRVPLAQAFEAADGGPRFTVAVNHFKSKGGCQEADAANADRGDGQGCWAATRTQSARLLHEWLDTDPAQSGSEHAIIIGDLNSFAQEDALRLLRDRGWRDAFAVAGVRQPYSYVWSGRAGRLDHALVSAGLAPFVSGAAIWAINADESDAFGYARGGAGDQPFRASDHDPLVIGLDFTRKP